MPKKSKKSKTKRQTLKQKYKVLKKVREHHRKKRKEARKNGTLGKEAKDPGIPNAWPFKEELIQQLKQQKERAKMREKFLREKQNEDMKMAAADEIQELQNQAVQQGAAYEEEAGNGGDVGPGYVDYSVRAFYKDFARVVEASDIIIEVLDARDPLGTRCKDVEKFVRKMGASKKIILLLNKIDLVPREAAEAWLKYLREEMPAIAFKCSTQKQSSNLSRKASTSARGSECLGADMLIQLLKNYARGTGGLKTSVTVGIVGLPNVGKSSLINSLKRSKVAKVGNLPGITKSVQEVHLDKQVTLLDSPGVVFAEAGEDGKAAAALRNCVKIEQLEDPSLPVSEILRRCPEKQLMTLYRIPQFDDVDGFLTHIATVRGKLRKGGTVDKTAAAKIILQDWNDGKIPYFTSPPERKSEVQGSSAIFTNWSEDFDLAALENEQAAVIETLDSVDMGSGAKIFFQADTAGEARMAVDVDSDVMDEDQPQPGSKRQLRSQNDRLYDNEGQYNPHKSKGKKKAKHENYQDVAEMEADSDSDFDFAEIPEAENAFAQLENDSE